MPAKMNIGKAASTHKTEQRMLSADRAMQLQRSRETQSTMRAFILITAMVLASATAAGRGKKLVGRRGCDASAAIAPAGSASAQVSETPKVSETALS